MLDVWVIWRGVLETGSRGKVKGARGKGKGAGGKLQRDVAI